MTMRAKRYQTSAALLLFMRRTTTPHSSLLTSNWRVELSHAINGRHAPGLTLYPALDFPLTKPSFPPTFSLYLIDFACIINKAQKYFAYSFL